MSFLPAVDQILGIAERGLKKEAFGQVRAVAGLRIEVVGLESAVGDLCLIQGPQGETPAEVVAFGQGHLILMPLTDTRGISPGDRVYSTSRPMSVRVGPQLLGRVLDGLGAPLDGGPVIRGQERSILADCPSPLSRPQILEPIETGIASIDGFMTLGKGQRLGIFAGSGVGKSTLTGMLARGSSADVNVIALIGERGREVKDFLEESLGPEGLAKSVLIVATSDASPLLRFKATFSAITIAEHFRDLGNDVLFIMDSVTRFATAAREIGLTVGEPPTLRGYPPSLFAELPRVVERLGNTEKGSITGLFTVLVEGDDFNEPVSDAMRGLLDGHVILDRGIATKSNFPAVHVLNSISRLQSRIVRPEHLEAAQLLRRLMSTYDENRDLIQVGAYRQGIDKELDLAVQLMPWIEKLIFHGTEVRPMEVTLQGMSELVSQVQDLVPA